MALTEDVGSEVRRILTNNTIDQCIQYNQSIKRDIVAAQEELRDVIGQRYRELLEACDRVVGMEDICTSIESSYQSTLEKHHRNPAAAHSTSAARKPTVLPAQQEPHVQGARRASSQVAILIECEDTLRSCRVLTSQGAFGAAAKACVELRRLEEELSESSSAGDELHQNLSLRRRFASLQVSGTFLAREIYNQMVSQLAATATSCQIGKAVLPPFAHGARVLADIHVGIEVMEKCSPATALSKLLALHDDVLDRIQASTKTEDDAVATAQGAQHAMMTLGWYLSQVEKNRLQELDGLDSITDPAATLVDLAQLDPKTYSVKGDYLKKIRLHLCGHTAASKRRFSKSTSSTSSVEGWALSPAGTVPAIQVSYSEYRRVEEHALEVVHHVLSKFVTSSKALLQIETVLMAPLQTAPKSAQPSFWSAASWGEAVQRSINTAVEGAVAAALKRAHSGLHSALQSQQNAVTAQIPSPLAPRGFKRVGMGAALSNHVQEEAVISTILAANGYGSSSSGDSAHTVWKAHDDAEDVFESSLVQLNSILAAAAGRSTTIDEQVSKSSSAFSPKVVQLLLSGIETMCDSLASATTTGGSGTSSSSSSLPPLADDQQNVFQSRLCSVVAKVISDFKSNVPSESEATRKVVELETRVTNMYSACHQQWLKEVCERFSSDVVNAYQHTLVRPEFFQHVSGDHVCNAQFLSAHVKASLCNVWRTEMVEGTTEVSFPVFYTPGVGRAVFEAHSELLARLDTCGGCLSASLHSQFGSALVAALLQCVKQLVVAKKVSPICEEAAFQMYFDLSLLVRMMLVSTTGAGASHQLRQDVAELLRELQDNSIDVVNFSVAKDVIQRAVDAAALQNAFSMGLAVSPEYPAEATVENAAAQNNKHSTTFACAVIVEKEADRLPLLPIATPSQVRNIAPSLHGSGPSNGDLSGRSAANGGGGATAQQSSISAASSLWSATSKLRNLWGQ